MATFEEALLKERLWTWLEETMEMDVEGEVDLGTGRIDLVAKTPSGEFWGIELKRDAGIGFGSTLYDQAHRYMESGQLDKLYFASPEVDQIQKAFLGGHPPDIQIISQASQKLGKGIEEGRYTVETVLAAVDVQFDESFLERPISGSPSTREYIKQKLESSGRSGKDAVSLEVGLRQLARARFPTELGVIHIPQNISDGVFRAVERHLDPQQAYEPQILREASQIERSSEPEFARREEPWVRHRCWRAFGGLPEGHIPNVLDSDQPYRPIDLLAFPESYDPADTIREPELNEIVGIEAKGESSYQPTQVAEQLSQFLETETMTRLYLAVPESLADQAARLIETEDDLDSIGVLSVSEAGELSIRRHATARQPVYDGYMEQHTVRKVGYGEIELADGKPVENPYITSEEAERLKNSDAAAYARDILVDHTDHTDVDGWLRYQLEDTDCPPESDFNKSKARAYLLRGRSADPYTQGKGIGSRDMKDGYVRLTLSDYTYEGELALKLHFGRGSWEGGYIWFANDELQQLHTILRSLETISGGAVEGLGKVLDLETYPFDHGENEPHRVSGSSGEESVQALTIESVMDENVAARFRLGEGGKAGVDVTATEAQWLDLIATIDVLIETGNHRELPGEYSSYPRIGPDGDDTWSLGTKIEEQIRPELST